MLFLQILDQAENDCLRLTLQHKNAITSMTKKKRFIIKAKGYRIRLLLQRLALADNKKQPKDAFKLESFNALPSAKKSVDTIAKCAPTFARWVFKHLLLSRPRCQGKYSLSFRLWGQCYKTFYASNLLMFIISQCLFLVRLSSLV